MLVEGPLKHLHALGSRHPPSILDRACDRGKPTANVGQLIVECVIEVEHGDHGLTPS